MTHTHVTAPTLFAEANGIRYAYRRFGQETRVPLLFMQHFRGGLDHWDPAITDAGYDPVRVGGLDKARALEDLSWLLFAAAQDGAPVFYRFAAPGELLTRPAPAKSRNAQDFARLRARGHHPRLLGPVQAPGRRVPHGDTNRETGQ